jgi:superfamily I DNA/RNA helicase
MSEKHEKLELERKACTTAVLNSKSNKKIIVAGPGTGKSFIFQKICEQNIASGLTKNLALSFINELVDDLSVDLYQLADVKTLHSFALSKIKGERKISLILTSIVDEDYKAATGVMIDFRELFNDLSVTKDQIQFYLDRSKFYKYLCPSSSIYIVVMSYENDKTKIPSFSQILVDEFQDFNKLETKLIDLLGEKSPVLIVGDDDQALYSWKKASPEDIRSRHTKGEYEVFNLPYCSRCTEVIIKSFDNIIQKAKSSGFLADRIDKGYKYFATEKKDQESLENPKIIIRKNIYQKSVADFVKHEIANISNPKNNDSVLVVCSSKAQINDLRLRLLQKGFKNVHVTQNNGNELVIEGLELLLVDSKDNLGWRILAKHILLEKEFLRIIKTSAAKTGETYEFSSLLSIESKKTIKRLLSIFRKIISDKPTSKEEAQLLFDFIGIDITEAAAQQLRKSISKNTFQKNLYKNTPIRITNILGSKGLTYDYVFLANFDDKFIIGKKITNESICKFLVALTRARKRVCISTCGDKLPTFVEWIGAENCEIS